MGLLRKLGLSASVAGPLLLSSAYALHENFDKPFDKDTLVNNKVVEFALKARDHIRYTGITGWGDDNGKTKGVFMMWDFNKDGNYDLVASYEFVQGSIEDLNKYTLGVMQEYPSEILFNMDGIKFDTKKGDIYLKRNEQGKYERGGMIDKGPEI